MKLSNIKLKWKIVFYIFIMSALIICLFTFFQIGMLETFYRNNKINSIEKELQQVNTIIDNNIDQLLNGDFNEQLNSISSDNETAIYVFDMSGETKVILNSGNYLYKFQNLDIFKDIIAKADEISLTNFFITFEPDQATTAKIFPAVSKKPIKSIDTSVIYGNFLYSGTNQYLLVLEARLTPVAPAVKVLKNQLFIITFIVIILVIVMSIFISKRISKPIDDMNETAKKLGEGKRDIEFKGKGYAEIKELNESLNYAVAELNKTDTLQKELLANISHDLKTPLTLISGYAEMMKDMPSEVTPENLQIIVDETNRLNDLVNDLLSLSRLQSRTESFNMEDLSITDLISSIVNRQKELNSSFQFEYNYDENIIVNADMKKISQVIYNFITNAINYSGTSKKIIITQKVIEDKVRITVQDFGIGIKEEDLDYVWNRYYRVDKGHNREVKGTGLGLAIVKEILEYHNFTYGIDSKENEGSSFYFEMPIIRKER